MAAYVGPTVHNKKLLANLTPDSSSNVVSKTGASESSAVAIGAPVSSKAPEPKPNILNKYRSVTYNFTLAGLYKEAVNDPTSYRKSELELVILKSGGKGTTGIKTFGGPTSAQVEANTKLQTDQAATVASIAASQKNIDTLKINADLIPGFNKNSPGRFDMFIDNIEIESVMAFTPESNASLTIPFRFEVYEPYSINGFIESLHVAAVAAGYTSYNTASFVLKMEFVGYPDDKDLPNPEVIQGSERYFVFGFSGLEVDITEKGTRYRCAAVPYNELGFGQPNTMKKPVNATGSTVKEMIQSLMENLNEQEVNSDKDSRVQSTTHNEYAVEFEVWDNAQGFIASDNAIGNSPIIVEEKDTKNAAYNDPGANGPMKNAYHISTSTYAHATIGAPNTKPVANFSDSSNIHEAISSIIRDSTYLRNIIRTMGQPGNPDEHGMVDYFLIRLEVTNKPEIDDRSKKPYQKFTYKIAPYKIHYTVIPNYGDIIKDTSNLQSIALKSYNYIYTGQNIDVVNFRLNFNTLFFEAIPTSMGANDAPTTKNASSPSGNVDEKSGTRDVTEATKTDLPTAGQRTDSTSQEMNTTNGPSAGPAQTDPYFILARNMHNAIVNSNASMIVGEIEILGDPFYLTTGGIGNYNPKPSGTRGETADGEANQNYGQLLININFRNPIDIGPNGFMKFEDELVPFSGIYRVTKATSHFKNGEFKQNLEIIRVPGIIGTNLTKTDIANATKSVPDPINQAAVNTAPTPDQASSVDTPATALPSQTNILDAAAEATRIQNILNGVSGSVESKASAVQSKVGIISNAGSNLSSAVTTQFGSSGSPLSKIASA